MKVGNRTGSSATGGASAGGVRGTAGVFAPGEGDKTGKQIDLPLDSYEINFGEGYIAYDLSRFPQLPAYASGNMPLYLAHI